MIYYQHVFKYNEGIGLFYHVYRAVLGVCSDILNGAEQYVSSK